MKVPVAGVAELRAQAQAAQGAGDHAGAFRALEQALLLEPHDPGLWAALAKLLLAAGRNVEAHAAADSALAFAPQDADTVLGLAKVVNECGDGARAEALLRALLARAPHDSEARATLARMLERANRLDDAEREAREGLKVAPGHALLNLVMAECAFRRRDLDLCEMFIGRIRNATGLIPQHLAYLSAQLLAARERHAEAYAAFDAANRIAAAYAASLGQRPDAHLEQLREERRIFNAAWVSGWSVLAPPVPLPFAPAFLVGFPRSGTTLLEQILDAHPGVASIEEQYLLEPHFQGHARAHPHWLADLDQATRERIRARYVASVLARRPDAAGRVMVDKLPLRLTQAGAVQRLFPEARFLFALRHPYDVVLSCFMQELQPNPAMTNLYTLAGAARFYDLVMSMWEQHRAQQPLSVVTVRYEALVEDLEAEVRPALAHLGLDWDPRVEAFAEHARGRRIRTPSYAQVSKPLYTSARARFVDYLPHFSAEVRALLDPWVERWGYAPVAAAAPPQGGA
jgi:hypothetical protein